ncbi:MAG: MFS transporter, partial [Candidatus Micropelagos sp.]|nr:MFS transporter [Candidatus Micropelagos sp.]
MSHNNNSSQISQTDTGSRMSSHLLLALLTFINILNFVDRQLIASFANDIKPDLDLSNFHYSLLTGLSFILFYSIMGLFMGTLADRLHRPRLLAFGLGLWSLFTAFSGMARSFTAMLIPRMLIGVGESVATPTSLSLLSDRYNKAELGL